MIHSFLGAALELLAFPIPLLWSHVQDSLEDIPFFSEGPIARFSDRHPVFGEPDAICCFLGCLIFSVVTVVVTVLTGSFNDLCDGTVLMYPFFFLVSLIVEGAPSFSIVSLLSAAFSGLLIGWFYDFCMRDYLYRDCFLGWVVAFVYYIVTTVASCILGFFLSNVWDWMAETGVSIFESLRNLVSNADRSFLGICTFVGLGLLLIVISYVGILLVLTALREYLDLFRFSAIVLLIFAVISLVIPQNAIETPLLTLVGILALVILVGVEFVRVNRDEIFIGGDDS